ncbi:MAG: hypothetical protein ACE5LV_04830 [Candidatus Aminicenantales bacterium]
MDEAEKIYRILFKRPIPPSLKARYFQAVEKFSSSFSREDITACEAAVERARDLEAVEAAARLRRKLPFLVWKFRLMVFLAEAWPENREFFINDQDERLRAVCLLGLRLVRSALKLIKGMVYLTRRRRWTTS